MRSKKRRADSQSEKRFYERFYEDRACATHGQTSFETAVRSFAPTLPETSRRLLESLGEIEENLRICELGCGDGRLTVKLAEKGGWVSAVDIAKSATRQALLRIRESGLEDKVDVSQMDACCISFKDETFDLVVGKEILHHLDLEKAAKEINRILKKNGKAVFVEPLAHNPISNLWRKMTPACRTANECPLSYGDIHGLGSRFGSTTYEEFHFLTLLSSFVYFFTHSIRAKRKSVEFLSKLEILLLRRLKLDSSIAKRLCAVVLIQFKK